MDGLSFPDLLDIHEAELDTAIAEDAAAPRPTREQAMRNALALVAASGRASRYAEQCTGGWMADPGLYARIHRWVMARFAPMRTEALDRVRTP